MNASDFQTLIMRLQEMDEPEPLKAEYYDKFPVAEIMARIALCGATEQEYILDGEECQALTIYAVVIARMVELADRAMKEDEANTAVLKAQVRTLKRELRYALGLDEKQHPSARFTQKYNEPGKPVF